MSYYICITKDINYLGGNKMKKIAILLITTVMLFALIANVYAANVAATLTANSTTVAPGAEVVLTITLKDFTDTEKGVNNFKGTLSYDKNIFETIQVQEEGSTTTDNMKALNNWEVPAYNPSTQEFVTQKGSFVKTQQQIMTITLKVKSNIPDNTRTTVEIKGLMAANSEEQYEIADASIELIVKKTSNPLNNNNVIEIIPSTNTIANNTTIVVNRVNTNTNISTVINSTLPQTGISNVMTVIIFVLIVNSAIAFIKYKKQ